MNQCSALMTAWHVWPMRHCTSLPQSLWQPNSPEPNPVDYKIWSSCRSVSTAILDTADVKQRLTAAWSGLQQHVINEAIDQWRRRLCACVRTDGRHFDH